MHTFLMYHPNSSIQKNTSMPREGNPPHLTKLRSREINRRSSEIKIGLRQTKTGTYDLGYLNRITISDDLLLISRYLSFVKWEDFPLLAWRCFSVYYRLGDT